MDRESRFVLDHTALADVPFVPGVRLHLATRDVSSLWEATESWLHVHDVPPPFWAFAWAGGQGLARHILDYPQIVRGKRVLDFACGGGIVAIAAALAGASRVTAIDLDPFAAAACVKNAEENEVRIAVECRDCVDDACPDVQVLLAGDVWYEMPSAARFLPWMREVATTAKVLTGDPGRAYVPTERVLEVARYDVPTPEGLEGAAFRTTRVLEVLP